MPDPTSEQFEAAARKVWETAPKGLSRESIYARIKQELSGIPPTTLSTGFLPSGPAVDIPQSKSEVEANNSLLGRTVKALRGGSPGVSVIANLIPLLLSSIPNMQRAPNVGGEFTVKNVLGRYGSAAKTAAKETKPGILSKLSYPARVVGAAADAMPSVSERASERMGLSPALAERNPAPKIQPPSPDAWDRARTAAPPKVTPRLVKGPAPTPEASIQKSLEEILGGQEAPGASSAPPDAALTPGGRPGVSGSQYDAITQAAQSAPDQSRVVNPSSENMVPGVRLVKGGGSEVPPTLEDSLQQMIQGQLTQDAPTDMLPPQPETVGAGPLKQSGKFGKSQSLGQAGGYSSGNPGITEEQASQRIRPDITDYHGQPVEWPPVSGGGPEASSPGGGAPGAGAVSLTPVEEAPSPAAGPTTAKEALQNAEDRLSGLPKEKLSRQEWNDLIKRQGLSKTAANAGLSKQEVADLAGIDINIKRPRPLEAQERIDAFDAKNR